MSMESAAIPQAHSLQLVHTLVAKPEIGAPTPIVFSFPTAAVLFVVLWASRPRPIERPGVRELARTAFSRLARHQTRQAENPLASGFAFLTAFRGGRLKTSRTEKGRGSAAKKTSPARRRLAAVAGGSRCGSSQERPKRNANRRLRGGGVFLAPNGPRGRQGHPGEPAGRFQADGWALSSWPAPGVRSLTLAARV
jgi:hypothetical protein